MDRYGAIKKSFGINLTIMRILGLYTPENYSRCFEVQSYVMYFLFIIFLPILTLIRFISDDDLDTSQVNYNASYLAQTAASITKILPFIKNSHQIKQCIHYFEDPYLGVYTQEQKKIIDDCVKICRRNSTIFSVSLTVAIISWTCKPFFLPGFRFPLDVWLPFDPTTGPMIYYSVYFFLTAGFSYAALSTMIDPLLGGLACQAAGQLRVLKYNLQHLGEEEEDDNYGKIIECIDHHNTILIFVKKYEECFSSVVFSQFAAGVFAICFCTLQLSMMQFYTFDGLSSAVNVGLSLCQIYFYCYYGTLIFQENYSLTNAIYMGKWYDYDVKSKKALIILMERSKIPMIVTAGKILDLSLDTFTLILRRSYSLLAVLRNYNA